jgi:transcriptional regulator with XRE-family HTH domain
MTAQLAPSVFGDELRRWRTRLGVSQLDLATRTGTTQRHVSFIERGRSAPGRTMVVRLAESLELSLRERNALLLTAGYAPVYPESTLEEPHLRSVRAAVDSVLRGHEPYPAVVMHTHGEVIAANKAFEVLTEGVDPELLAPPVNGYRMALHPRGMAPRILNLGEWGRHITEALRATVRRTDDAELRELLTELEGYVPPWTPSADHIGFAVPLRLRCRDGDLTLITTLATFATAVDVALSELRLEAFLPADDLTATLLRRRAG